MPTCSADENHQRQFSMKASEMAKIDQLRVKSRIGYKFELRGTILALQMGKITPGQIFLVFPSCNLSVRG
jgi:hypothetical protein